MKDVLHMSITPFQVGLVVKKCKGKLDCLIYEMLFIKNKRPCLKIQSDSTRAKLSSFSCTLFIASHGIYRGYYTVVRRYEFYFRMVRTMSHPFASFTRQILFLPRQHKIHIFEPTCNILFIIWRLNIRD